MSVPRDVLERDKGLTDFCVLHAYRGSVAHGMYTPSSDPDSIDDKDTMALCVPPLDHYLGLKQYGNRGTREVKHGEWDIVIYEATKAVSMLAKANPNVMSLLWLPSNLYIRKTPVGEMLINNRDAFVGKHAFNPFIGYARGQLVKMEGGAHRGYMGEKRKELVERFGYDTKNAAHCIRILRMGIEFLTEGVLHVERDDVKELMAIKRGEWELAQVKQEAESLFRLAEQAYVRSPLPPRPDPVRVNQLCVDVVFDALRYRGELTAL